MKCFALALFAAVASAQTNYNYDKAGADWTGLCQTGLQQSPIDILTKNEEYAKDAALDKSKYSDFKADISSQVSQSGMYMKFSSGRLHYVNEKGNSQAFQPIGLKFKSPSEHKINGKQMAVEVQFIHKYENTESSMGANLSIFFDPTSDQNARQTVIDAKTGKKTSKKVAKGGDNAFLASILAGKPTATAKGTPLTGVQLKGFSEDINLMEFWAYNGSWTTPPCTEGIKWLVLKQVQGMSAAQVTQIKAYNKLARGVNGDSNARAIQAIGDRRVFFRTPMSASALAASAASVLAAAYLF